MSKILVSLATLATDIPTGNGAFASYSFALFPSVSGVPTPGAPASTQSATVAPTVDAPVTFDLDALSLPDGEYIVAVKAVDVSGAAMGSTLTSTSVTTGPVVVPPNPQFDAPSSITVSVA